MEQKQTVQKRIYENAKVLRIISRAQMFQRNRKIGKELSYLRQYNQESQNAIRESLEGQIPNPLPPLSPMTISYYRRSNQSIYKTRFCESDPLDPHMTYQSLWILAGLQEEHYSNYQSIINEFEKDLNVFLDCPYNQIKEMAVIAAGNKILGQEKDILKMVEQDKKQIWVMINHIYEKRISFTALYPYITENNPIIFRTIFEMTNYKDDQIIESIIENQYILGQIIDSLNHTNPEIQKYSLCIIGNILAEKEQYAYTLQNYKILDSFYYLLSNSDPSIRKDVCWAISNYAFEKGPATDILYNTKVMERLLQLLKNDNNSEVKIELGHIFAHLVAFADKKLVFKMIVQENIIERCNDLIDEDNIELNWIINLGNDFVSDDIYDGQNLFCVRIRQSSFHHKIIVKSYSNSKNISAVSLQILEKLEKFDE